MSGDVQPRKRKDKRRKKEGGSLGNIHEVPSVKTKSRSSEEREESPVRATATDNGENIHVQHDHGIGGNVFVKIIFFALLAALLGLVGLIFIESRGSTDIDLPSIEDSRFAEYFTGWLDDTPDDHGHDDHAIASGEDGDEEDHGDDEHGDEDHSAAEEDDEHGDEDDDEGHSEAEEEENTGEDVNDTKEDDDDDDEDDEVGADSEEEEAAQSENENGDNEDDESDAVTDDSEEMDDDDDDDKNGGDDDDDDDLKDDSDDENNDEDEDSEEEEDEDEDDDDFDLTQEDGSAEVSRDLPKPKKESDETVDSGIEDDGADDNDDDEGFVDAEKDGPKSDEVKDSDDDNEEEVENEVEEESREKNRPEVEDDGSEIVEEIEESEEAQKEEEEALRKEKMSLLEIEDDDLSTDDPKLRRKKERELQRKLEKLLKEQQKAVEGIDGDGEENSGDEEDAETGGVALKLSVGVAMIIVAHLVLVRKWQDLQQPPQHAGEDANDEPAETEAQAATASDTDELPVGRRQTLIPENIEIEPEEEEDLEDEQEYSDDEVYEPEIAPKTAQEVKLDRLDPDKYYTKEELGDSEDLEDEEDLENEEYEEEEPETSLTPSDQGEEEELEDEELEEEEEEEDSWQVTQKPVPPPVRRGPQGLDEDEETTGTSQDEPATKEQEDSLETPVAPEPSVENIAETKLSEDDDDWLFRQELDFADDQLQNNPRTSLKTYEALLIKNETHVRALLGKAKALDKLAEIERSNNLLSQAISAYQKVITGFGSYVNDSLFREIAERCIDRMRFGGKLSQAIPVHQALIAKFPLEPSHKNTLGVTLLIVNQIKAAKRTFEEVLKMWPDNGFAQVHLGFILKTSDGLLEEGAKLLDVGIRSEEPGVIDGRFFFHLGDALNRLGRNSEAMQLYELGVEKGLFLSKYQRSLYNVNRLAGRPWWSHDETTYAEFFKALERNWKVIREEGLALLNAKDVNLFKDEAESLKDTGDWKQLDLFFRGRKQPSCNRAKVTCNLVSSFGPASTCSRGQVKFSVMFPGTHVWPHCGPTNCRLRSHLGLVVPPGTHIRVAEETRTWKEGKVLVFDDSFEHEVWHNGTSPRLVLIVDIWHPQLTLHEKQTLPPI